MKKRLFWIAATVVFGLVVLFASHKIMAIFRDTGSPDSFARSPAVMSSVTPTSVAPTPVATDPITGYEIVTRDTYNYGGTQEIPGGTYTALLVRDAGISFTVSEDGLFVSTFHLRDVVCSEDYTASWTSDAPIPILNHSFTVGGEWDTFAIGGHFEGAGRVHGSLSIHDPTGPASCNGFTTEWTAHGPTFASSPTPVPSPTPPTPTSQSGSEFSPTVLQQCEGADVIMVEGQGTNCTISEGLCLCW